MVSEYSANDIENEIKTATEYFEDVMPQNITKDNLKVIAFSHSGTNREDLSFVVVYLTEGFGAAILQTGKVGWHIAATKNKDFLNVLSAQVMS